MENLRQDPDQGSKRCVLRYLPGVQKPPIRIPREGDYLARHPGRGQQGRTLFDVLQHHERRPTFERQQVLSTNEGKDNVGETQENGPTGLRSRTQNGS